MSADILTNGGSRVVVFEYGETPLEALESCTRIEAQPAPQLDELGPTDVVFGVRASSVGWVDLIMSSGQYQHMAPPPYTPGLEYSGDVLWVGAEVSRHAVGDKVFADGLEVGPRSYGDYQRWGGMASYAVAPESALYPLPESFDYAQGCNLLGAYETAYHCLFARGRLKKDEWVLIHGASGTTGLAAVHLAKLAGAKVIATGRSPEKLRVVTEQGADHCIDTRGDDGQLRSFKDEVKELTGGKGVHVVYDPVGGPISTESMRCVRFGARFLIVGWAATPFVARGKGKRGAPNANQLPTNLIMMKGLDVLGCPAVISTRFDPTLRPQRLEKILAWVREGAIQPYISHRFPFAAYKDALRTKWEGAVIGGAVLEI